MSLENSIKDCISKELEKGIVEKVIANKLESCVSEALRDMFGYGGEVKKVIKKKIESVMIPYLESYDYSKYITKLDSVLVEVLKSTALENKKMLENFKELMLVDPNIKTVKVSDIFNKWCSYVEDSVNTDELEVDTDDEPSYECVHVTYEFEQTEGRDWLRRESARIIFECEHDKEMNVCIDIYRYSDIQKENEWKFSVNEKIELSSLRYLDEFKLYLMSLNQAGTRIIIDETGDYDDITPSKEPEASYY